MARASEDVQVHLRPDIIRDIGGVTRLDRDQFVTIHEGPDSSDMTPEDHRLLREELDVRYGRNGGVLSWQAKQVPADPADADMPRVDAIQVMKAAKPKSGRSEVTSRWNADVRQTVLCTHPELMHGIPGNDHTSWGPRNFEGVAEFTAQFLRSCYTEASRPRYLEVFNEPFVKAEKIGTTIDALSEQHNVVARRVRELCPDVLIGGYSAAWVELEVNNFGHFESRQKRFMDIAGAEMDFWSYHIYDGVNVTGTERNRTGSNAEAIMDLIDSYSHQRFGVAKPILITEFGKIPSESMNPAPYSARRSAEMLYGLMGQLVMFMDHPDRLAKVIPFILGKAEWTYASDTEPGAANVFLLWRRAPNGDYVKTDLFLFYEFLRDLGGEWRAAHSSNPDVRVQLLADGNRLLLLLTNLDETQHRVVVSGLDGIEPKRVIGRFLHTDGGEPVLGERVLPQLPSKLRLRPGASAMVIVELDEPITPRGTVREQRVYASECLQDIRAKRPARFTFPDAPSGRGHATVRVSTGRPPGLHKRPTLVLLNGEALEVPDNWAGDSQAGRKNYFGTIEVPAPAELVRPGSVVEVVYPDGGGKVASVVLRLDYEESGGP
ncbi:beta-agarase [Botrimarina hoheduenensis]|nr:beta-agarase [Botrimarina hoheduenensis]